jgi:peptide/nickel transport system substrate-binding protein
MFRLTRRQALLAGASGLVLLAGCGKSRQSSGVAPEAAGATPKRGGSVAIGISGAPPTLDAQITTSSYARDINLHIFETLYARDENGRSVPDLAEGVQVKDGGKTYVFALRKGVKFHNGKEMKSEDVVASLERYRKFGACSRLIDVVDMIKATGQYEVTVGLKYVMGGFLDRISSPMAPLAIYPAEEAIKPPDQLKIVGTGPYRLVEYIHDSHVKLVRFADYAENTAYSGRDGLAGRKEVFLDEVTFRFMPDSGAELAALQAGELQFIEDTDGVLANILDKAKFTVYRDVPFYIEVLKFNHARSPTSDVHFRRAVSAALNMEAIMGIAYPDIFTLNGGWVYPNSPYATPRGTDLYNINSVVLAKQHLAKSSYRGEELTLIVENYPPDVDAVTVIQEQLSAIGVDVAIRPSDWPTVTKIGFTHENWHMWMQGMGIEPYDGPATIMSVWVNGTSQQQDDPIIDKLYNDFNLELDDTQRKNIFGEFQQHMYEQAVAAPIAQYGVFQVATSRLRNYVPERIPRMWGVWLEQASLSR